MGEINFKVSKNVLEAIINYLVEQPYKEVNGLLIALQGVKPIVEDIQVKEAEVVKAKVARKNKK